MAETETAGWHSEVLMPVLEAGMTESEMLQGPGRPGVSDAPLREQPCSPSTTGSRNTPEPRRRSRWLSARKANRRGWNPRWTVQMARASARFEIPRGMPPCDGTGGRPTLLNS
jgi:hypothetical protein